MEEPSTDAQPAAEPVSGLEDASNDTKNDIVNEQIEAPKTEDPMDLFGDDDEGQIAAPAIEKDEDEELDREPISQDQTAAEDTPKKSEEEGEGVFEEDDGDEYVSVQERCVELEIPKDAPPCGPEEELCHVRVPNFLKFEPRVFQTDTFVSDVIEDTQSNEGIPQRVQWQMNKLRVDNNVRWRHKRDAEGNIVGKESNCRFVRWSDGTTSLMLGNDFYDASIKKTPLEHTYYCSSHNAQGVLQVYKKITKDIALLPLNTSSLTHKKVQDAVNAQQISKNKVMEYVTEQDPEKLKRDAEQAENERLRAKRRLESRQRAQNTQYMQDEPRDLSGFGFSRPVSKTYQDEDDEGFIVEDEEEEANAEQQRMERLRKIKQQGQERYLERANAEDEEDEEMEEGEEEEVEQAEEHEEDEEEEAQFTESENGDEVNKPPEGPQGEQPVTAGEEDAAARSKRRRIIESDNEDEE